MIKSILSSFEEGKLEEAKSGCMKILSLEPNNGEVLHILGRIEYACKNYHQAAKKLLNALKIDPGNPNFHLTLGRIFKEMGLNQEAIECFKTAITLDGTMTNAFLFLGLLYFKSGETEKALDIFRESLKKQMIDAEIFYVMAQCFEKLDRIQKAVKYYHKALACIPNFLGIRSWFQSYLLFDHDPKPYDRIFLSDIYQKLARCLYRTGQLEDSLLAVNASIDLNRFNLQAKMIQKALRAELNHSKSIFGKKADTPDENMKGIKPETKLSILMITSYSHKLKKNAHLSPPGIGLIKTTYHSLLKVFGHSLERCHKILCYDRNKTGSTEETDYRKNLEVFCDNNNFDFVLKDHYGLQGIIMDVVEKISTPYLFFLEHDWEFIPPRIDLVKLIQVFDRHKNIHSVRFNKRVNKISNFDFIMEKETRIKELDLIRTSAHSNNPFIARLEKLRKDWLPMCKNDPLCKKIDLRGTAFGLENPLFKYHMADIRKYGFQKAHESWGTYIYGKSGDPPRIVHLGE